MINEVRILGRLGQDPEIRYSQNGLQIASFSLATSWKPKDGEEVTDWHRCVAFGAMADQIAQCHKGNLVSVYGRLQTRKWQAEDGTDRWTTEVVANVAVKSSWHKQQGDGNGQSRGYGQQATTGGGQRNGGQQRQAGMGASQSAPRTDFDDDVPF